MARKSSLNSHLSKKSVPKVDHSSCLSSNAWIGKSPLDGDARVLYIHITCFIHWIQKIPSCCISSCLSCYGVDSLRYIHAFINHSLNQIARLECKSFQFNARRQVMDFTFVQTTTRPFFSVRTNQKHFCQDECWNYEKNNIQLNSIWLKISAFSDHDAFISFPLVFHQTHTPASVPAPAKHSRTQWYMACSFCTNQKHSMFHRTNQNGINMHTCHTL